MFFFVWQFTVHSMIRMSSQPARCIPTFFWKKATFQKKGSDRLCQENYEKRQFFNYSVLFQREAQSPSANVPPPPMKKFIWMSQLMLTSLVGVHQSLQVLHVFLHVVPLFLHLVQRQQLQWIYKDWLVGLNIPLQLLNFLVRWAEMTIHTLMQTMQTAINSVHVSERYEWTKTRRSACMGW